MKTLPNTQMAKLMGCYGEMKGISPLLCKFVLGYPQQEICVKKSPDEVGFQEFVVGLRIDADKCTAQDEGLEHYRNPTRAGVGRA